MHDAAFSLAGVADGLLADRGVSVSLALRAGSLGGSLDGLPRVGPGSGASAGPPGRVPRPGWQPARAFALGIVPMPHARRPVFRAGHAACSYVFSPAGARPSCRSNAGSGQSEISEIAVMTRCPDAVCRGLRSRELRESGPRGPGYETRRYKLRYS